MYDGISYGCYLDTPLCRVSIDNIRLKFSYKYQNYDFRRGEAVPSVDQVSRLLDGLELYFDGIDTSWSYCDFFKLGNYSRTCTMKGDGWSFAVMIGRYCTDSTTKQVAPEAVIDFNPNKVPQTAFSRIISLLNGSAVTASLIRYDIAFDYACKRNEVFFASDLSRSYKQFREPGVNGAVTEYQGERSSHGAVKIYDKTKESGLSCDVTRCEITVDKKNKKQLADLYPALFNFSNVQIDTSFSELPFPVQACILHPDLLPLLSEMSFKTRKKYLEQIAHYDRVSMIPNDWKEIERFIETALMTYTNPKKTGW